MDDETKKTSHQKYLVKQWDNWLWTYEGWIYELEDMVWGAYFEAGKPLPEDFTPFK